VVPASCSGTFRLKDSAVAGQIVTTILFTGADALPSGVGSEPVAAAHFGLNLVAHAIPADLHGFAGSALAEAVAGLAPGSIRYPGGTVTELLFDPADENATLRGGTRMIPQAEAIAFAARTGATLDLVLQTRTGFETSAAEALRGGTYGERAVSVAYLEMTRDYVLRSLRDAAASGVAVATFEIGNEFFYSGEMTAAEYGRLSRDVLAVVQSAIDSVALPGGPRPLVLVQTLNATGRFSPLEDTRAWVSDGEVSFAPVRGWEEVVVPGQGTAARQARDIADQITGILTGAPDLSGLVDGLVGHDYNARGHRTEGVQPMSYMFAQFDRQEARLGAAPGSLSRHVTEWNARAFVPGADGSSNDPVAALNRGLPHAALLVEMFFQFHQNGVDAANIWPVYFAASNTTNLLDFESYDQRLPAAIFGMMQESLIGLSPAFFSHDAGPGYRFDTYAYAGDGRIVLFVSSRLATVTGPVTLVPGDALDPDAARALARSSYFIARTELSAVDPAGRPTDGIWTGDARPLLIHGDGGMARGDRIGIDHLGGHGTVRVEVTFVGPGCDVVQGRNGNDQVRGLAGDDSLSGGAGNDRLRGNGGDDWLQGDDGDDSLLGGDGRDRLSGGPGHDRLSGGAGNDVISGGKDDDLLRGEAGNDLLRGDAGNDRLHGGDGDDLLSGGQGRDWLVGGAGDDVLTGGRQADVFVFGGAFGSDRITDFRQSGADRIDLSALGGVDDVARLEDVLARVSVEGEDLAITFAGGRILLDGMAGYTLEARDFLF
jgi:hypothetical protein